MNTNNINSSDKGSGYMDWVNDSTVPVVTYAKVFSSIRMLTDELFDDFQTMKAAREALNKENSEEKNDERSEEKNDERSEEKNDENNDEKNDERNEENNDDEKNDERSEENNDERSEEKNDERNEENNDDEKNDERSEENNDDEKNDERSEGDQDVRRAKEDVRRAEEEVRRAQAVRRAEEVQRAGQLLLQLPMWRAQVGQRVCHLRDVSRAHALANSLAKDSSEVSEARLADIRQRGGEISRIIRAVRLEDEKYRAVGFEEDIRREKEVQAAQRTLRRAQEALRIAKVWRELEGLVATRSDCSCLD